MLLGFLFELFIVRHAISVPIARAFSKARLKIYSPGVTKTRNGKRNGAVKTENEMSFEGKQNI